MPASMRSSSRRTRPGASRRATAPRTGTWTAEQAATQYELFARYDRLGESDYRALAAECAERGLTFLSTPFDIESVGWLTELMPMVKIASADLTNVVLLRRIAATGKPALLSTGAATLEEIGAAVELLRANGCPEVALLHCTLSYPTKAEDAAIGALLALREAFPECALGYSDHTVPGDSFAAIAAAVALGARIIEKHYTLDKSLPGNDHYHAFDPADFGRLRSELDRLHVLLGSGTKDVLPAEEAARLHARRSLVARGDIPAGAVIDEAMLDVKRPGTGIEPARIGEVVGRRAAVAIPDDTTLLWEMLDGDGAG